MTLVSSVHMWRSDAAQDFMLFCIWIYLFPSNEEYGNMSWPSYKLMKFHVYSKVYGIALFMRVSYKEALHF